jgi:hypothetical protein
MENNYGLPQPLTGAETVTIHQVQNGQVALCTMPLSQLATILTSGGSGGSTAWVAGLSTAEPTTPGVVWNNAGVVSIS